MAPTFDDLMRAQLAGADDLEVVLSEVELPPHTELPVHTHPGEEFVYMMEGSLVLWEQGKGETLVSAGDSVKVPLGAVHTVRTEEQGCKLIAFRVHAAGEPERTLVELDD
jgi:quercetin dioxygenase-like cupin family protein